MVSSFIAFVRSWNSNRHQKAYSLYLIYQLFYDLIPLYSYHTDVLERYYHLHPSIYFLYCPSTVEYFMTNPSFDML